MPNPKVGTVTFDVGKAVSEVKAGKVEYRVEKAGIVHVPIGKVSFGPDKLIDNARRAVEQLRPCEAGGREGELPAECVGVVDDGTGNQGRPAGRPGRGVRRLQ